MKKGMKKILNFWLIYFVIWLFLNALTTTSEGFCLVPLNMSLCSTPGAIEGNKVTYMNYAHDLIKGGPPNPPAWHDDLGESVRVPSDPKPPDFGPKVPEKGSYGKKANDSAGADGHHELMAVPGGHSATAHQHTPPFESKNSYNVG